MKKILFNYSYSGIGEEYYLIHPNNIAAWVGIINIDDTIQIDYSLTFENIFKKEVDKLNDIYYKTFNSGEEAMQELKIAVQNVGFKIINKDMGVYL